jgi:hypothetical protein
MIVKNMSLLRDGTTLCGIHNVLAKDKVDEKVDILYVTTRKASSQMEIKRQRGRNEIIGMINTVKKRRKVKTVLKDYKKRSNEDR